MSDKQCCLRTLRSVETLKKVKGHKKCTLKGKMLDVTLSSDKFLHYFHWYVCSEMGARAP